MRNEYEKDLEFSKKGLVGLFDKILKDNNFKVLEAAKDNKFKLSMSTGTHLDKQLPCYKSEFEFDSKYSFKRIAKAIVNFRDLWDDSI